MYRFFNPNPRRRKTEDCYIRAVCAALNIDWDAAYTLCTAEGFREKDVPHSNAVWGAVLRANGYTKRTLDNACPDCITVAEFAASHPRGVYVVGLQTHVVTVIDGDWLDIFDSGDEIPLYIWHKEE